jgi:hypothetical protein
MATDTIICNRAFALYAYWKQVGIIQKSQRIEQGITVWVKNQAFKAGKKLVIKLAQKNICS